MESVYFTREEVEGAAGVAPWRRQREFHDEINPAEMGDTAAAYARASGEARNAQDLGVRATQISQQGGGLDGSSLVNAQGRIDATEQALQRGGADIDAVVGQIVGGMNAALDTEDGVRALIYAGGTGLETKYANHLKAASGEWSGWHQALGAAVEEWNSSVAPGGHLTSPVVNYGGETVTAVQAGTSGNTITWALPDSTAEQIRTKHLKNAANDATTTHTEMEELIEVYRRTMTERAGELRRLGYDPAAGPLGGLFSGEAISADEIPVGESPESVKAWWNSLSTPGQTELSPAQRALVERFPALIGNLDGIPAEVRDDANRRYLPTLIAELDAKRDPESEKKADGLRAIQTRLGDDPDMYLLGIGGEGNGRAIISFGNPDLARNVSAMVPGLETQLDTRITNPNGAVDWAKRTAEEARAAEEARGLDPSSASIFWLGYDAPLVGGGTDVAGDAHARAGAPAFQQFLDGVNVTNDYIDPVTHEQVDPHVTAIGHSYGSLTVGTAAREPGGIKADDIILIGSPGVGADHAEDLGVGPDHVFVGSADNDIVTHAPSQGEVLGGAVGSALGPPGVVVGSDLADWNDDDLWHGRDPASEAFGAQRFRVDDGQVPFLEDSDGMAAHNGYLVGNEESADNIGRIVSGHGTQITRDEHR
jgi:hypothetical protein